jgi:hypothetical protein
MYSPQGIRQLSEGKSLRGRVKVIIIRRMSNKRKPPVAEDKLRQRVCAVAKKLGIHPASKAFNVNRSTLERYIAGIAGARSTAGTIALLEKHIDAAEAACTVAE